MFVSNLKTTTELYNTLSEMGILCTEERRIRETRGHIGNKFVTTVPLSYRDIQRVGYFYPHFMIDRQPIEDLEIWIGDEYINPNAVDWIETDVHLFGIMKKAYDIEKDVVTIIRNENIFQRYTKIAEVEGEYVHIQRVDVSKPPFSSMDHPDKCAFYISGGKIYEPTVHKMDATHWEFHCPYTKDIDLFLCANLAGTYEVKANQGLFIDSPLSTRCYHHIVVDHDPNYPIETRFYPCISVDKDCMVRVFTDSSDLIPYPDISRLVNYPEFMMIIDPYHCDNEYLNNLPYVDDVILGSDDEEIILDKLSRIAAYCYRLWEKFPFFCNEQNDFLMCDNSRFGNPLFIETTVVTMTGATLDKIVTLVPFEGHRDILFYAGNVYSNYQVMKLRKIDQHYIEDPNGVPTYIIDPEGVDINRFTLIKFNAAEDTVINNIGDYISVENVLELHTKLNRFYRNMLILRGSVLDQYDDSMVRVSTVEPDIKDEHLWFELLVNVVPEMFVENPIESIKAAGLDPDEVPQNLKAGAYSLGFKADDGGPEEYTELLLTYFNLSKAHKDYLVLQEGPGVPDPRIVEGTEMNIGPLSESPELNQIAIHDPSLPEREGFEEYESGYGPPPDTLHHVGNIYAESMDDSGGDLNIPTGSDTAAGEDKSDFDDILGGVSVVPEDIFALETISYVDDETGKFITGQEIASYSTEQKKQIILRYITEGTDEDKTAVKILWESYLDTMDEETLNVAVYKVLLIDHVYSLAAGEPAYPYPEHGDIDDDGADYVVSDVKPEDAEIGMYWIEAPANINDPILQEAKLNNLKYIMSIREPDVTEIGTLWINIPGVTLQDYIGDIICSPLMENGYNLPEGFLMDLGDGDVRSTLTFDYGAHGGENEIELFRAVTDNTLRPVHAGPTYEGEPEDKSIWYEFLDEIDNQVCYSDTESMILNINERLLMLTFDHDNITAFMFDDIVLNFRGKLGLRYISILADLISSKVIDLKDINIFYKRLVTGEDIFDPALMRLYTGRYHVISTADIDTTDYSITYSTNIGRYHIDYNDESVHNREREAAWRMVIDYTRHDIAFLGDRMMLFVNGRYIPRTEYKEITAGKIQLLNFNEVIANVDFFYSKKDIHLSRAKRLAINYWTDPDTSVSIQRPERDYGKFAPMHICDRTYRGFYDVLMEEYVLNGRLFRELRYLEEHKDEAEFFVRDLVRKFNAISDMTLVGTPDADARIVIPAFGDNPVYTIKE